MGRRKKSSQQGPKNNGPTSQLPNGESSLLGADTENPPIPSTAKRNTSADDQEMLQAKMRAMAGVPPGISKKVSTAKLVSEPSARVVGASSTPVHNNVVQDLPSTMSSPSSAGPGAQSGYRASREMAENLQAFNTTSSPRPDGGLKLASPITDHQVSNALKTRPPDKLAAKRSTADEELQQAKIRAMGGVPPGISKKVSTAVLVSEPSARGFAASSTPANNRIVEESPSSMPSPSSPGHGAQSNYRASREMAANLKAFNATSSPRPDGGLQLAPPINDNQISIAETKYPPDLSDDQKLLQEKMRAMGGDVADISKQVSMAVLVTESSTQASAASASSDDMVAGPPSTITSSNPDPATHTMYRAAREMAEYVKASNVSSGPRPDGGLQVAPPIENEWGSRPSLHAGTGDHVENASTDQMAPAQVSLASAVDTLRIAEHSRASLGPNLMSNAIPSDEAGSSDSQPGSHVGQTAGQRRPRDRTNRGQRIADTDKNTLLIDRRAAPQEGSDTVDIETSLHEQANDNQEESNLEALAASGGRFVSVQRNVVSGATLPDNDAWVGPTRVSRSPAQGYTLNAAAKGRNEGASMTQDGSLPGAVSVLTRAAGSRYRPAWHGTNNSPTSLVGGSSQLLSGSHHSSTPSQGLAPSATSTQNPSARHLSSRSVQNPDDLRVYSLEQRAAEMDQSNIPPELRQVRNSNGRLAPIISWFSRNSQSTDNENDNEGKDSDSGCIGRNLVLIIIGGLVLVIGLGAGLAFGLGGGGDDDDDKPSTLTANPTARLPPTSAPTTGSTTMTPTVNVDFSLFQSYVDDLYEDLSIFQDARSPQYRAMAWLAGDMSNLDLGEGKIRTLYALAVLFYSTNGPNFLADPTWDQTVGFLGSTDECSWNGQDQNGVPIGVYCDTAQNVQSLYLASNNLVGSLPEEIGALTALERLQLGFNSLSSTIPSSLFELSKLAVVDLSTNSFSGTIPDSLSKASSSLSTLHLGWNQLQGPVSSLDSFWDSSDCPLEFLVLTDNKLSGTFPLESIAVNCTNLHSLNLESSGLTAGGSIPSTGLEQLTILNLRQMGLTGIIPDSISRLSLLSALMLDFNDVQGAIPESLGQLTNLTELSLSNNRFEGVVPSSLGQLQQLTILDLGTNLLSGSLPPELAFCSNLERAAFEANFLSGTMDFFCPRDPDLLILLTADCSSFGNVVCSCCSECF